MIFVPSGVPGKRIKLLRDEGFVVSTERGRYRPPQIGSLLKHALNGSGNPHARPGAAQEGPAAFRGGAFSSTP